MARRAHFFVGIGIGLLILPGCGNATQDSLVDGPYAADIRAAQSRATSQFERDVLADEKITKAEFDEAVDRYVACAHDRGIDVTKTDVGGYYNYSFVKSDAGDRVADECRAGTIDLIESLYVGQLINPNKADINELHAQCLVRAGAAPAGYTGEQLKRDQAAGFAGAPFAPDDPKVSACYANPNTAQ